MGLKYFVDWPIIQSLQIEDVLFRVALSFDQQCLNLYPSTAALRFANLLSCMMHISASSWTVKLMRNLCSASVYRWLTWQGDIYHCAIRIWLHELSQFKANITCRANFFLKPDKTWKEFVLSFIVSVLFFGFVTVLPLKDGLKSFAIYWGGIRRPWCCFFFQLLFLRPFRIIPWLPKHVLHLIWVLY